MAASLDHHECCSPACCSPAEIHSVAQVTKLYHSHRPMDIETMLPGSIVSENKKIFSPVGRGGGGAVDSMSSLSSSLSSPQIPEYSPVSGSSAFHRFDTSPSEQSVKDLSAQFLASAESSLYKSAGSRHPLANILSPHKSDPAACSSRPQLNLLPLMQQWSMAAARHAAILNGTAGSPYFPYGLLPTPQAPNPLMPSPFSASQPSVDSFSSVSSLASGQPGIPSLSGLPTRRQSNPFKPPPLKKYKCEECGKAFSRSNTLVTHKRIHTGEKPFKCDSCGRAFRQPGNLTRHKLTHTTVKPYVCPTCNKAFNRASNLHTHMRTHANFRPFICHLCGKSFQQKIDLKVHFYTHTGLFPVPNGL